MPRPKKNRIRPAHTGTANLPAGKMPPRLRTLGLSLPLTIASLTPAYADDTMTESALPATVVSAKRFDPYRVGVIGGGALGERAPLDTPFSVTAVTSAAMADRQVTTLNDVFRGDPAVTPFSDGYNGESSYFSVRGMQLDLLNGFKLDGMAFPNWSSDLPLESFERVELLKGLAGFMYGFGTPGGIVNYVLKRPTDTPTRNATLGFKSDGVLTEQADLGGRFGPHRQFGYRLDAVHEAGETYVRDGSIRRDSMSLALDWRITPDLTWWADGMYQRRKTHGVLYGISLAPGVAVPRALDGSAALAQPYTFYLTQLQTVGTGLRYRVAPNWHASLAYRLAQEIRTNQNSWLAVQDNAGNYSDTQYFGLARFNYQQWQAMLQGSTTLGGIRHELVFGASWQQQRKSSAFMSTLLGVSNLYAPTLLPNAAVSPDLDPRPNDRLTQTSVFASDTLHLSQRWSVLAGLRYTDYRDVSYGAGGAPGANYQRRPLTPTLAVLFKSSPQSTLYASYVESLEQGGTAPLGTANYNQSFAPLKSRQYEAGFKTEHGRWGGSAALFRVERGLAYTNADNLFVQDGKVRYQGLEIEGWIKPARAWQLRGGAMWLDAKNQQAAAGVDGKRAYGAPRFQASGRIEYSVAALPGLTLALGGKYVGDIALESNNTHTLPSYYTLDASARYHTRLAGRAVTLRAGVNNLTNRRYWLGSWEFLMLPGAPRTFLASAQIAF
ncbi:hypothetical protein PATSB16_20780 [Pandoraea thiooxydans]|nr:TonB-dependent receptor [Pandoraea thiooxydans]APR95418.1 hypothetical protein PATSB16_20780 [Pandoraea thiooxydans]